MSNPNPYGAENCGDANAVGKCQPSAMTDWLSRLPISLVLITVGTLAIVAHELTISHPPWNVERKYVTLVWCGIALATIGSGIGFLLNRRYGLMVGAILGPIILWAVLAIALYVYLEMSGERLFGD